MLTNSCNTHRMFFLFECSFFSNIVTNLKIPEHKDYNISLNENVSDPIIKLILKYKNHPSILTIGEVCKKYKVFIKNKKRSGTSFSALFSA